MSNNKKDSYTLMIDYLEFSIADQLYDILKTLHVCLSICLEKKTTALCPKSSSFIGLGVKLQVVCYVRLLVQHISTRVG